MHILPWVLLIALLIGLGMFLKRTWLAQQAAAATAEESDPASTEVAKGFAAQMKGMFQERVQGLQRALGREDQVDTVALFREWAAQNFTANPEIRHWLTALTDEQIGALTTHLQAFCNDMGFELTWVLDRRLKSNTELTQGLTQIVTLYSRASYEAVKLQEEVESFRIYRDYIQNPQSRANRELGEHLFGKLVEQGKSTVSISSHLAASSRKRQQQIVETIQHVAVNEPKAFNSLLKTVLYERMQTQLATQPEMVNHNGAVAQTQSHAP
ncbi:MAG TPA: hypothetical protein P5121_14835 [Caldilineaceae bacterium]|nr:hypothetical protein [Caldilineaceae bacterium]